MKRLVIILMLLASPLWAVDPKEMLDDPVLEERARTLSQELRCPVCRNESIDESNAALSQELRIVLRERMLAGDTDHQRRERDLVARRTSVIVDRAGYRLVYHPGQAVGARRPVRG